MNDAFGNECDGNGRLMSYYEPMSPDTLAFAETIKVMNNWSIKNMNSLKELVQHINRLAPGSLVVVDTCGANCANTQRQWLTKELQACGIPMRDSSTFDILLGNGTKICLVGPHYDRNNKDASREITMRISCVEIDRLDRLSRNPVPPYRAPNVWIPGITEQVLFEAKAESVNRTTIKLPCGCYNITRWNYNVARGLLIEEAVEDENLCKMHVVSQNVKEVMRDIAKELAKNFIQK